MIEPLIYGVFKSTRGIVSFTESNDQFNDTVRLILVDSTVMTFIEEMFQRFDLLGNKSREYWRIGCIGCMG